jgi:hypothetical protein
MRGIRVICARDLRHTLVSRALSVGSRALSAGGGRLSCHLLGSERYPRPTVLFAAICTAGELKTNYRPRYSVYGSPPEH